MSNWTCPHCGREENDEPPHAEIELSDELSADVTCKTVYVIHESDMGVAMDHDQFEELIEHYRRAEE